MGIRRLNVGVYEANEIGAYSLDSLRVPKGPAGTLLPPVA